MRHVLFAALLLPSVASASPNFVSHSGRLLDVLGVPVDGPHSLTFELVDTTDGDTVVFTQNTTVDLDDGYYAVELGAVDPGILGADLDIRVREGQSVLAHQTLTAVPYALSVDGSVRVSAEPECGPGAEGTLRYDSGTLQVCNGTVYAPIGRTVGVVDYQNAFTKTPATPNASLAFNASNPPSSNEGHEVAQVTLAAKTPGNTIVLDGQVVYSENGNSSNSVTVWVIRESDGQVLAVVADSVHSNAGGCAYAASYENLCTTNLHYAFAAPDTQPQTYSLRIGFDGGNFLLNRSQGGYTRGGLTSGITAMEIAL